MNNPQKQQVLEQVKSANNVLVSVSSNPTVDELAASVGLTLALNKLGKHATTVFSGVVPSTIEFLQPEKTIETTTDSLRDFIIALDKSKADKLRYKVENDVVRIFITPYRASITDKDLEFSQGDFNVDVVLALGVNRQEDLDRAITAHGRILHDATVISLTNREVSELGQINWQEIQASSLCEMVASIVTELSPEVLDGQMATAFLTGIIAETDRFKNEKTSPLALSLSSQLMSAGANQQLIAEKLDEPEAAPTVHHSLNGNPDEQQADGTLEISHDGNGEVDNIHIDEHGNLGGHENDLPEIADNSSDSVPLPEEPTEDQAQENIPEPLAAESEPAQDEEPQDVGSSLFEDLANAGAAGVNDSEKPTLQQPDSTSTPMMEHKQTMIEPLAHEGDVPKTDKPFDLAEAMAQSADPQEELAPESSDSAPSVPVLDSAPLPEPESTPVPDQPEVAATVPSPSTDSLADLEKSVGSPHAAAAEPPVQSVAPNFLPSESEPIDQNAAIPAELAQIADNFDPPKVAGREELDAKDPNAPPPVPPPMTPQFYDSDGNNNNPFLNPHP